MALGPGWGYKTKGKHKSPDQVMAMLKEAENELQSASEHGAVAGWFHRSGGCEDLKEVGRRLKVKQRG